MFSDLRQGTARAVSRRAAIRKTETTKAIKSSRIQPASDQEETRRSTSEQRRKRVSFTWSLQLSSLTSLSFWLWRMLCARAMVCMKKQLPCQDKASLVSGDGKSWSREKQCMQHQCSGKKQHFERIQAMCDCSQIWIHERITKVCDCSQIQNDERITNVCEQIQEQTRFTALGVIIWPFVVYTCVYHVSLRKVETTCDYQNACAHHK